MYRHYKVTRMTSKAKRVVRDLFGQYFREPDCLPPEWLARTNRAGTPKTARVVADYIAGMTDGYALREHERQF
jgi:dGTPase